MVSNTLSYPIAKDEYRIVDGEILPAIGTQFDALDGDESAALADRLLDKLHRLEWDRDTAKWRGSRCRHGSHTTSSREQCTYNRKLERTRSTRLNRECKLLEQTIVTLRKQS